MSYNLKDNPFHILRLSCDADRVTIIDTAAAMIPVLGDFVCNNAQSELMIPNKRLQAEIDWFPGLALPKLTAINALIDNGKEIPTEELNGISLLNALLHNMDLGKPDSVDGAVKSIFLIDKAFGAIDTSLVLKDINYMHTEGGIEAISQSEAVDLVKYKRINVFKHTYLYSTHNCSVPQDEIMLMLAKELKKQPEPNKHSVITEILYHYMHYLKTELPKCQQAIEADMKLAYHKGNPGVQKTIDEIVMHADSWITQAAVAAELLKPNFERFPEFKVVINEIIAETSILCTDAQIPEAALRIVGLLIKYYGDYPDYAGRLSSLKDEYSNKVARKKEQAKPAHRPVPPVSIPEKPVAKQNAGKPATTIYPMIPSLQLGFNSAARKPAVTNAERAATLYSELRNTNEARDNTWYQVAIKGDFFSAPPYCTCCLRQTKKAEPVFCVDGDGVRMRRVTVSLPVCKDCLKHRSKLNKICKYISIVALLIGLVGAAAWYVL